VVNVEQMICSRSISRHSNKRRHAMGSGDASNFRRQRNSTRAPDL